MHFTKTSSLLPGEVLTSSGYGVFRRLLPTCIGVLLMSSSAWCSPFVPAKKAGSSVSRTSTGRLAIGQRLLRQDAYKRAEVVFNAVVEADPKSISGHNGLASALYGLGQHEAALKQTDLARDLLKESGQASDSEDSYNLYLVQGKIFHELGKYDDALGALSKAIEADKHAAEPYVLRASNYDALGKSNDAIADLTKALEIDPNDPDVCLRRALLYRHEKDYKRALDDFDHAVSLKPEVITLRASFNKEQGKSQAAIDDYTRAIDFESGSGQAAHFFNRGVIYEDLDQHRLAIADFTRAIRQNARSAEYFMHRGMSFFGVSDFRKAIADFAQAIAMEPSNAEPYFFRASAYAEDGQKEKALDDFDHAIKLDAVTNPSFFMKRALLRSELGKHDLAVEDITKAIELSKGAEPDYYFDRGMEHSVSGEHQKSIADFSKCIEGQPENVFAYKQRAIAKFKMGDKNGALEDLQKSSELFERDGDMHGRAEVARLIQQWKAN